MKIISGGIQHETNLFSDTPTTLEDFIRDTHLGGDLPGGEAILKRFAGTNTIHGGYLVGAEDTGLELVPVLNTRAYPSGMVLRDCFEHLSGVLIQRTRNALPADGILLDLHGAMITEDYEDAEAEIVRRVRTLVGPDVPIVVTLDLHANISPALPDYATVIIGYDTYPHTDMGDRGKEAVTLLNRILNHDIQPVQAYRQLPLLTLPPGQCTMREPMQSVIRELHELESRPGMLTATVAMGFPFADIHDMGVSVLATSDGNLNQANQVADQLAAHLWNLREALQPELVSIHDAMSIAANTDGLVIFADGSDNPGGGAPCDGTVALQAMIDADFINGLVAAIYDPETVQQASHAGLGATITAIIGGKTDALHGPSVHADAKVIALGDGHYIHGGPMAHGLEDSMGNTALLKIGSVKVLLCSLRRQLMDRNMLLSAGVNLEQARLMVLKSAVHFRADFSSMAKVILDADTPGIHRPDFSCFDYKNVRSGCYPLDPDVCYGQT